ncbi:restriction endonuclease subunit S [Lactobacillus johnsonii]|uniref:restriction endonuclease subunit S n=1 Tax=Lactobacillus johnsonii TaxID=33959 RepID=UPI001FB42D2B|nr:restriction endonuclease subunit S [Lactobacillus johnsonii]UOC05534.1 restriction endonuclease subunit S [Lactobacillus johnsonii]
MTKSNDKKVPALRFKGFTDDWEQRKFNKIANKIGATSSAKIPNVSYDDILSKRGVLNKKISKLSTGKKGIKFKENDILFGKLRPYLKNYLLADFSGIAIGDFWVLRPLESPDFLFYLIQSQKFTYISNISSGSKMPRSDWKLVSSFHFDIPKINEQIGIGKVLKLLDKLISLQQRKLEQLNLLQRALLQRIFANRNLQPDLRFTNFSGAWEQHKLGNMANILRGASPRPIKDKKWFDTNSRIGWIRISDVTSQNGRVYTLGQHLSKKGQEKTHVVSSQTLLLSIAASVGYPVITYVETGVHDGFIIFDKPKFNLDFMFFKLQSIQNIWSKYGQPGSQVNINSSIVANTSISIPNIKEQKKISILLKKIEENIHLQQNKINKLQELKRSFLQNIFI